MYTQRGSLTQICAMIASLMIVFSAMTLPVLANDVELQAEASSRYYELKAKVEYLLAFIDALRDGERSPAPTFVTVISGSQVSVFGTVARDPQTDLIEICGPMSKGSIDWGDGTKETILGLGCSGDVQTFSFAHEYTESGSYKIRAEDLMGRDKTHVVAPKIQE